MDGEISEFSTDSIETSPLMSTDQKQEDTVELNIDNINSQEVAEIKNMLPPEVLSENRKHAHGINVLGEGLVGYDYISPEIEAKFLENPKQILVQ